MLVKRQDSRKISDYDIVTDKISSTMSKRNYKFRFKEKKHFSTDFFMKFIITCKNKLQYNHNSNNNNAIVHGTAYINIKSTKN